MADVTKPTVYVETSVVSYLTARPLSDPIVAGQMAATREWWADAPAQFDLYTSALVIAEASAGDAKAAAERLTALATLPQVPLTDEARDLAAALIAAAAMPSRARVDALHVATAATNGLDYLVTWNYRPLAK